MSLDFLNKKFKNDANFLFDNLFYWNIQDCNKIYNQAYIFSNYLHLVFKWTKNMFFSTLKSSLNIIH